jgi:hypothetical protein
MKLLLEDPDPLDGSAGRGSPVDGQGIGAVKGGEKTAQRASSTKDWRDPVTHVTAVGREHGPF